MKKIRKHAEVLILIGIVLIAVLLRLYRVTNPVADWHSFRQADTASVTREFLKHGIQPLIPTYHDLSNIQSGKDNPHGYRMVEFPILNIVTAVLIQLFHVQAFEVIVGRLVSIAYSAVTLVALYLLVRNWSGRIAATWAAITFAVLPYAVYYSRAILPEAPFIACLTVTLAALSYWTTKKHPALFWVAVLSFAEALLHKPYGLFLIPLIAYEFLRTWKWKTFTMWQPYVFGAVSLAPLAAWRWWIQRFPEGIPASDWLFNTDNIRWNGAFFHWIFEVRISTLILGIGLVVPLVIALAKRGRDWGNYIVWAICLFAYVSVLASGNVRHDYYQVIFLPFLCAAVGRGFSALYELQPKVFTRWSFWAMATGILLFSLFVSWYTLRGYFNVNHWEIVEAGKEADKILPKDAKVIAPYDGDTAFLFQTNRTGWPQGFEIQDKINKGAQYYISVNMNDEAKSLMQQYTVLSFTPKYVIIDLQKPRR